MRVEEVETRHTAIAGHEEFVFPTNLFEVAQDPSTVFWTCARARPRFEKKLCFSLRSQSIPHYMPVVIRKTWSGRKLRTTSIPLFPGFVFVLGNHTKATFKDSGCVTSVLKPTCPMHVKELDGQIRAVHRMLALGGSVGVTHRHQVGDRVTIASGPLRGLSGTITSTAHVKRLVLWVDMLGVGAFVQLGPEISLVTDGVAHDRDRAVRAAMQPDRHVPRSRS